MGIFLIHNVVGRDFFLVRSREKGNARYVSHGAERECDETMNQIKLKFLNYRAKEEVFVHILKIITFFKFKG